MAWARITHRWPDGSETQVEVGTDTAGYPDVMRELVARVSDLWGVTCQGEDEADD